MRAARESSLGELAAVLELACFACACGSSGAARPAAPLPAKGEQAVRFGDDLAFLSQHSAVVVLEDAERKARVVVAPEYQGRVMTSTSGGDAGPSFGFIHRDVIAEGVRRPHMNVFGGEDRFWLGPEGGQFALYFPPGASFDLDHWQVPEPIDWGAWNVTSSSASEIRLQKEMQLRNYHGTLFSLRVERSVRLLGRDALAQALGAELPQSLELVAYESENSVTNTGSEAWTKAGGLLSIWILGMYNPGLHTTVVIPYVRGSEAELGPIVNDAYFGKVPPERLAVRDGLLFFRGDGQQRGKIGIPRPRARPVVGAYDADAKVLTLVQYTLPENAKDYVNSAWALQEQPYGGDVVNSYNDGPPEPGKPPLGPFYELESSSPAAELAPGESLTHVHRTLHVSGPEPELDRLAQHVFGVGLSRIRQVFAPEAIVASR